MGKNAGRRKQGRSALKPRKSLSLKDSSLKNSSQNNSDPDNKSFCVVGIGASAGGLEALETLFQNMPADSGLAFVIVQHLDPGHKSIMVDILKRHTRMKVLEVEEGMPVRSNCVYVIPPNRNLTLANGKLHLTEMGPHYGAKLPIDLFLRSLAEDKGAKSICIILSGTGTDGTIGLKTIKEAGGMTMVQEEISAKYTGMPRSAISTGAVDFVLPVEKMPAELTGYVKHPYVSDSMALSKAPNYLEKIFTLLRNRTGHDFSNYKQNTIIRRIERRMAVHQIDRMSEYVRLLEKDGEELEALFKEFLIGVTSFFRDRGAFEVLEKKLVPRILTGKHPNSPVRVWVAGCSTGEEAYSIAILFMEEMERRGSPHKIQIFATDIDNYALDIGRLGLYPESIAADVSPERLKRFFIQEGHSYRIKKYVREAVIFAKQDLIKDPPFSKLDMIVCRNLLIYLGAMLQKKILPLFHYTLNPDGFLLLGSSESIGEFSDLFSLVDKKWKIFQRKGVPRAQVDFPMAVMGREEEQQKTALKHWKEPGVVQYAEKVLVEEFTPPCVIINEKGQILHFHGQTGNYLQPPSGEATLDILKMAREGLRIELRTAIHKAVKQKTAIMHAGISIDNNGNSRLINLLVRPLLEKSLQGLFLVIFEDVTPDRSASEESRIKQKGRPVDKRAHDLEQELNSTKESLQTTIEEIETSNEELKSTNEELQSTNEEMQSTNEELETSREELQSVNEELTTVNSELQNKLDELSTANDDMMNLLSSTKIGTIFLDNHLIIKRFTSEITHLIHLIPTDVGRPIEQIAFNLVNVHLHEEAREVLRSLVYKEKEVRTKEGGWYLMKILPYRTNANVIQGVVITFVNISDVKKDRQTTRSALKYANEIISMMQEPLLVLDSRLQVLSSNEPFRKLFRTPKTGNGASVYNMGDDQWNIPELKKLLEEVLPKNQTVENYKIEHHFLGIGPKKLLFNARKIKDPAEDPAGEGLILLMIRDITINPRGGVKNEEDGQKNYPAADTSRRTPKVREGKK